MTEDISILDAIHTTRAIRRFKSEPVSLGLVEKVLEAATQGPSGMNSQPWRFVVVEDPALKARIGDLYRESYESNPRRVEKEPDESRNPSLYLARHLAEVPVLILVCGPQRTGPGGQSPMSLVTPAGIYPAVQNLLLAARAYGLGGALTVNHAPKMAEIRSLLGMPEDYLVFALVPLGYPAERHGPKSRKPVREVTFYNRWAAPLPESGA